MASMKIAIVYTGDISQTTDFWHELAGRQDVELRIWCEVTKSRLSIDEAKKVLDGLWVHWDYGENVSNIELAQVEHEIVAFAPDFILACGWGADLPSYIARSLKLADVPMALEQHGSLGGYIKMFIARLLLWWRMRRYSAVIVHGAKYDPVALADKVIEVAALHVLHT